MANKEKNTFSDSELEEMINRSAQSPQPAPAAKKEAVVALNVTRDMLIIGCGDGGSTIASAIKVATGFPTITYNTSARAMANVKSDIKLIQTNEDGTGKIREYSKEIFRKGSHVELLEAVNTLLSNTKVEYIVVCSTTDGGTGSGISPMISKLVADNTDVPVIILGVYPTLTEDATAQFNTLNWQAEVNKINLPYIIFDNETGKSQSKSIIHSNVNSQIVDIIRFLSGKMYGSSNITMIDNRDMYMLIEHIGKRIAAVTATAKPNVTQTLDDYVGKILEENNYQPKPYGSSGIGVFVKGPVDLIEKMDTSLMGIRSIYGDATVQYVHVEESDDIRISVVFTGCNEPVDRLITIKGRYDDIMSAQVKSASILDDLLGGADNPLGKVSAKHADTNNMAALDL